MGSVPNFFVNVKETATRPGTPAERGPLIDFPFAPHHQVLETSFGETYEAHFSKVKREWGFAIRGFKKEEASTANSS